MNDSVTYQKAGVDPDKAGKILSDFSTYLKSRPKDPNLIAGIGPFASCYRLSPLTEGMKDPVLVTSCDGVGTKVKLAFDWNYLEGLGQDLVAMNVNDVLCAGGRPLFFLDYYACGKLDEKQLSMLLKSIQSGCEIAGMSLAGGETAEMPGIYSSGHFDLAGFVVGIADRERLVDPARVKAGDKVIGLRSRGFHSNGYSLVRAIVEKEKLSPDERPTFDKRTWREILLEPTQIYVKPVLPLLGKLHALAHLTGGGLFENFPRVLPAGTIAAIDSKSWAIPELFRWFQKKANIDDRQLLSTFNCGMGMLAVIAPENVAAVQRELESAGIETAEVGTIESGKAAEPAGVVWR